MKVQRIVEQQVFKSVNVEIVFETVPQQEDKSHD